jgi:predicted ribosome quality control (RQC) complex YloA/Tae2 family protein
MGSDLFTLASLADELNQTLAGGRIDKIQQPENDELRFFVRANGKTHCLCVSANAGAPRFHLTQSRKQNPEQAPAFLMLLRKHLAVSGIEQIGIYNNDRILFIKFNARSEMRDNCVFYLFAEIMNRYSNVIFTDENLTILDAVKYIPFDEKRAYAVLRGVKYQPITQPKTSYLTASIDIFDKFEGGDLHKFILDNISGFSGVTASELLAQAEIEPDCPKLDDTQKSALANTLDLFRNINRSELYSPCVFRNKEVYVFPYKVLAEIGITKKSPISDTNEYYRFFPNMSDAYDALYTECDNELRNKARLKEISNAVKRLIAKTEKNITIDVERLSECENADYFKLCGELIVSNIFKIKKGDDALVCTNYYSGENITIPLDNKLSPSKNSAAYYAKYNKLKRTKAFTEEKLSRDKLLLEYAKSIEHEVNSLEYGASSSGVESELERLGAYKRKSAKSKVRKEKPEPPDTYLCGGFTILAGKNNLQNEELTFRIASSSDIWLHLKNRHGMHTVILCEGKSVPEDVLNTAAEITAATAGASAEVDYTERRNVKRQPNGHPGQVIYVNYKTILATPDKHLELRQN